MVSLKSGVLLKLLEAMKMEDCDTQDDPEKAVMLQIRSIIPVLEEGDLWPNRGFFLKVSDLSHAIYVSLSEEENEMILGNKLKLGQFIYVQKLENSDPVPLLRGITLLPWRSPCEGMPEDIASPVTFLNFLESSDVGSMIEKGVICEEKITKTKNAEDFDPFYRISEKPKARAEDFEKCTSVNDPDCFGNDSDADSVISSASSSRTLRRRSWNESDLYGVKQIFDSSVAKRKIKLPPRSRSANVSPVRSSRYESSDDNSSTSSRRKSNFSTKRPISNSTKGVAKKGFKARSQSLLNESKRVGTGISWNSLPPDIAMLGKDVVRQKEIALLAAAQALQEACVSERLLNSLSKFSQFSLVEFDGLQLNVDKFFELEEELARSRLIMRSLTNISPSETSPGSSIKETLSIAVERKRATMAWLRSAVAVDLSLSSAPSPRNRMDDSTKKTSTQPRTRCILETDRISTSSVDTPPYMHSDKEEQVGWSRGCSLPAAASLATSLQEESRKVLLINVEKFVDEVERRSSGIELDGEMAATMHKVKMASDLLDMIVNRHGNDTCTKEGGLDEPEAELYGRVRNKIYRILLKHVERTTMEFHRLKIPCR